MIALTRAVSPTLDRCQLTHLERVPLDVGRAADEHRAYERLLERLGCRVERVAPAPALPDAVFVEDTAVVTDELAVLCRPGAASRRREVDAVGDALARYRPLRRVEPPATLDGGDVLRVGRRVWVGLSERTTAAGAEQLRAILGPQGYRVEALPVRGCLHLKSAVTPLGDGTLLLNPAWVDVDAFDGLRLVEVAPGEPRAANVVVAGGEVVMPDGFPRTRERLADLGRTVRTVPLAELAKAEAGVTCCSILLDEPG
jgi:dimethylargininase